MRAKDDHAEGNSGKGCVRRVCENPREEVWGRCGWQGMGVTGRRMRADVLACMEEMGSARHKIISNGER